MSETNKVNFAIVPQMGRDGFIALLCQRFPQIEADIDDSCRGLLHCEMACFAHATQAAIDVSNVAEVRRHFDFAEELLRDAGSDVENAIYVSYLECIDFDGPAAKAIKCRELLPVRLRAALAELEAHLAQIHGPNAPA